MKIKNARDFYAGLMFMAFGVAFIVIARDYNMGSAVRMGPAYFPTVLGGLLALLGAIVTLRSFAMSPARLPPIVLRPLALILVAILLFGFLLRPLGLVLATVVLVVVGSLAGHEFRVRSVIALALVLAAFAVAVFFYGLGLPFNLWPQAMGD